MYAQAVIPEKPTQTRFSKSTRRHSDKRVLEQ
jgi:hypothetical protein